MECTRWHKNQQAYLEVIWKENKTDDVICLHFGVYGNICGHMIPSSVIYHCKVGETLIGSYKDMTHETHTILFTNSSKRASGSTPGVFQGVCF